MMDYTIGQNVVLGKNISIGKGTAIGNNVVVHDDTVIGKDVRIDDNSVIGKLPMKSKSSATTKDIKLKGAVIGDNCIIGSFVAIYRGAVIGSDVLVADMASIRENTTTGDFTIIGKNATIENNVAIGKRCKIQSNVQIVPYSLLEDDVFMSPGVMTSNDKYAGRTKKRFKEYKGLTMKRGARLGVACITLPGVVINEDAMVGAGSIVTKDVPARKIAFGTPAKVVKDVPEEQLRENQ
jgi:UDP-2-acetamido-3-amino-2,3-dideoxy-glucuronate N-acetyltransferase